MFRYNDDIDTILTIGGTIMTIRPIHIEDAESYLKMLHQLDLETKNMMYEPGERKTTVEEMKKHIEDTIKSGSLILIIEDAGKDCIAGFLALEKGFANRIKHSAYLVIGILTAYRGQGLGKRLFQEMDIWAKKNHITRIELTVMTHNEGGIHLYTKMGFHIEGTKVKSLVVDGAFVDEYYMAKLY